MNPDRLPTAAFHVQHFKTVQAPWSGANESGIEPVGTKLLVLTDWIDEETAGGITLPPSKIEELTYAITTGVVVAIGGAAFTNWPASSAPWPGKYPAIGDRIHIAKNAGIIIAGKDIRRYRLVQDTDVAGFETEYFPQHFGLKKPSSIVQPETTQ